MTAGDPVTIDVTLQVLARDLTERGTVACDSITWSFAAGMDTPSLSAVVATAEDALTADPDLFDDGGNGTLVRLLFAVNGAAAVPVGQLMMTQADDLTLVGGDDEAPAQTVQLACKAALLLTDEWVVTPQGGTWLRRSPERIYLGWMHPDYDTTGWGAPTRNAMSPAPTSAREGHPSTWPAAVLAVADWLSGPAAETGGLTLFTGATFTVDVQRKIIVGSTADEEHVGYLHRDGYGGAVILESDQETGYTHEQRWPEVLPAGTYHLSFEMTTVNSAGGDGLDALAFYVATVDSDGEPDTILAHSGEAGLVARRQPKVDPTPGFTIGQDLRILQEWAQAWITPLDASVHMVGATYTDTLDSNGAAWTEAVARSYAVGTSFASVLADLDAKTDLDMVIDAGLLKLAAYQRRGADLSATVALTSGEGGGLTGYRLPRRPRKATGGAFRVEDGFGTYTDTTAETTITARRVYVESGQAGSLGEGVEVVARVVADDAKRERWEAAMAAVEGAVPGVDFDWGGDISVLNRAGAAVAGNVSAWGGSRVGDNEPEFSASGTL